MNLFQSLVFGLISGLSDILPVSSQAHKAMMLKIFGINAEAPLLRLFIHAGILAALPGSCVLPGFPRRSVSVLLTPER